MKTKQERLDAISNAMESKERDNGDKYCYISKSCDPTLKDVLMTLIYDENIGGNNDMSYQIVSEACEIIAGKTLDGVGHDSLTSDDVDFFADADASANVYTGVQLSYLNPSNESEISDIFKDESQTSIAQACASWCIQKVVQACESLKDYILND